MGTDICMYIKCSSPLPCLDVIRSVLEFVPDQDSPVEEVFKYLNVKSLTGICVIYRCLFYSVYVECVVLFIDYGLDDAQMYLQLPSIDISVGSIK